MMGLFAVILGLELVCSACVFFLMPESKCFQGLETSITCDRLLDFQV